ncbi:CU044_5270 family protein [Streptomyces litchfieldiae]|uniref:CU044_5270 family protein n=1 Tax=Streptomyces litchfieldiae TaxID=3075543 RepID=A0ABU2MZS8_9ACTN|nr:CU044_5270 family protein [Streptomyces sp. DSM 44938]MDT0347156.1 CU044_5270 family protein [Streptomyces sp. DSM 44938]
MSSMPKDRPDVAELIGLLPDPAPDDAGLNPERQALLRSALRQEYRRPTPARSRSRRRLTLVLAPSAAACALAITAGLTSIGSLGGDPPGNEQEADPTAAQLLERAALTAARAPQVSPADDQYIYGETTGFTTGQVQDGDSFTTERQEVHGEMWASVDGSGPTLERDEYSDDWIPAPDPPSLSRPTYRLLETLPTDPDVLLEQIYAEAGRQYGEGSENPLEPDQGAFEIIGRLLSGGVLPTETAATLYRAAADIPGVVTLPDTEDAMGREGVAVAREHAGWRTEWILDEDTTRLLGLRTIVTESGPFGEAGTVYDSIAISRVGIVDEPGRRPTAAESGPDTGAVSGT